jgi:hypothetical protein
MPHCKQHKEILRISAEVCLSLNKDKGNWWTDTVSSTRSFHKVVILLCALFKYELPIIFQVCAEKYICIQILSKATQKSLDKEIVWWWYTRAADGDRHRLADSFVKSHVSCLIHYSTTRPRESLDSNTIIIRKIKKLCLLLTQSLVRPIVRFTGEKHLSLYVCTYVHMYITYVKKYPIWSNFFCAKGNFIQVTKCIHTAHH